MTFASSAYCWHTAPAGVTPMATAGRVILAHGPPGGAVAGRGLQQHFSQPISDQLINNVWRYEP